MRDILTVCNGGALLSHIITRANLSSYVWQSYWPELVAEDLIDEEAGAYNLTSKGQEWLKAHARLEEIEEVEPDVATLLPRTR